MSAHGSAQQIRVSHHVVRRFLQRTGHGWVSQADIEYRFREGYPVDVEEKVYAEARLVEVEGTLLVLLRKGTDITTLLYACEETVTFRGACPDVECDNCGAVQYSSEGLEACSVCGRTGLRLRAGAE